VFDDPLFGPVILFGAGGVATAIVKDSAAALPPLDIELARDLMQQTRIYRLLQGYRDRPAANLDAVADALVRLSQLVVDCPALRELDINPLLANETGVIALDARIRIEAAELDVPAPNPRLAIRHYPNRWEAGAAPKLSPLRRSRLRIRRRALPDRERHARSHGRSAGR
jgi:acetyltransferase